MSVAQREALVAGDAEGRQQVEALVQQGLEARGRGVGRVEQVVNLLTRRTQGGHWRGRNGGVLKTRCCVLPAAEVTKVFTFCTEVEVQILVEKILWLK